MAPPPPPQQNQSKAGTFNMTMKEAVQNPSIVVGTLSVNFIYVKVLIDSGAKNSFIYEEFVVKLCWEVQWLGETLIIKLANNYQVHVNQVCQNCVIKIAGHHFSADLIPFRLGNFDVILGMDWLAGHNAQIYYANKKVNLRTANNARVVFRGKKQNKKFLTMMQTKQFLRQGCKAYLAYVLDVNKKGPRSEDISVVCEFPNVFPDEFLGLSPDCEIEFTIDLVPGMLLETQPLEHFSVQLAIECLHGSQL
ncbi:uncharacterized protein LOC141700362 [Apium graveolens]|uniref:uncharacterized protein LOC141700362 n=1 Tax=Apium graveolens TaxID=4045 RepID=UPI003D7B4333